MKFSLVVHAALFLTQGVNAWRLTWYYPTERLEDRHNPSSTSNYPCTNFSPGGRTLLFEHNAGGQPSGTCKCIYFYINSGCVAGQYNYVCGSDWGTHTARPFHSFEVKNCH